MLELKNVTKYYDEKVIDDLSITFPGQGLVVIVGDSGCGKTTLLNIIGGIDQDYDGNIYLDHQNIREIKNYCRKHIGFIFQNFNLINWLNVKDNYSSSQFFGHSLFKRAIDDQVSKLELMKLKRKKVKILSGGQKQKVAMLRAMIKNVDILLCDEPTGSLDQSNAQIVFDLLKQEAKERLVIVITHDEMLASKYCDLLYHMENGKLKGNVTKDNNEFYPRYKTAKTKFSLFKLAILQYCSNFSRNLKMTFGIVLAIFCLLLTFTLSDSFNQQLQQQLNSLFPSQMISINHQNHQGIDYATLMALKDDEGNDYLYGEMVDYEFVGLSLNPEYDETKTVYISDMTKKVNETKLSSGRLINDDNEIILTKSTARHLSSDSLLNQEVYGFYLHDDEIKKISLKVVGISDEVTIFDTIYIKELANFQHVATLFHQDINSLNSQIIMMNLNSDGSMSKLKKQYPHLSFNIAGESIIERVNNYIDQGQKVLLLFSILAIVSSAFLIGEVLYLSVVEKTKDIGIFKCLGASRGQILFLVLFEVLIIVISSFVLSLLLMMEMVLVINDIMIKYLDFSGDFINIDYRLVVLIFAGSLLLGQISSLLPAIYASNLNPIKALKHQSY